MDTVESAAKLRSDFLEVLHSRRSPVVPLQRLHALQTLPAKRVVEPLYQGIPIDFEVMKSYPEALLNEENFYLPTEEGEQGRLPWLRPSLEDYASRGYIAIAIDSRYHGERAKTHTAYQDALVSSWKRGDTMPFIYDTVWDLLKLADYLTAREDIDHSKIGIKF
ncbi:unnamed protein product [Lactuca virosa]|uniref:Xaa-Pro dipeptidyl-peptidase-like domain-containing protein n=1 Tax=Lactuca virosa TaxID=75947 RepID=A0AAU9MYP4_9ASTR|nr:unnamed protein product [Lactuca virosa]